MISYRTKRSHARSRIKRIFSKVVFWRGSWVFWSFPLCLSGAEYRQSRATLNGNPKGRTTLKMGFPFAGGLLPRRKFIWSEDPLFSFLYWSGTILFSSDLFLFTFFQSLIRNPSFPFFSSLPFLSFHFSLSISFFGNSDFSISYSLSLEEILLSFSSRERMRILFMGQGSK